MPTKFLLPCSCGEKLPIEPGQAGQSVTCGCGNSLTVPTMREIARLERAEAPASAAAPVRWSPLQGVVFASGLLIVVAGLLAAAFFGINRANLPTVAGADIPISDENFEKHLEGASGENVYELWKQLERQGLGHWHPPEYVVYREISAMLLARTWYALIAAAVGASLAGSSFFLGSRRK